MQYERKEYPRPQFRREDWQGLNGEWEFAFDDKNEGIKSGLWQGNKALPLKINVPFSCEYLASGIGDPLQHDVVWYRRTFAIAEGNKGRRALLCFNAADYQTDVWLNGAHILTHTGGFTPFSADITEFLKEGKNTLVVRCEDTLNDAVPRGKQSWTGSPFACFYVPNTGIWQSVWLEFFGEDCIAEHSLFCDYDRTELYGELATLYGSADEAEITVTFDGKRIKRERLTLRGRHNRYRFALPKDYTDDYSWSPENPRLLYVDFALYKDGKQIDLAHTRIGMRKISVDEYGKICLNNRPYYQRLVLDQGYWARERADAALGGGTQKGHRTCKGDGIQRRKKTSEIGRSVLLLLCGRAWFSDVVRNAVCLSFLCGGGCCHHEGVAGNRQRGAKQYEQRVLCSAERELGRAGDGDGRKAEGLCPFAVPSHENARSYATHLHERRV